MCNMKFRDLGNFKFASARYKNGTICVGSLYFENGRIRLAHIDGPTVELFEADRLQLIIPDDMKIDSNYYKYEDLKIILHNSGENDYTTINNPERLQYWSETLEIGLISKQIPNNLTRGRCLLEIEEINHKSDYWVHVSRGVPYITLDLQNVCYKEIFNAVTTINRSAIETSNKKIQDIAMAYKIFTSL